MNAPDYIKPEELLRILFDSPNATAVYTGEDIIILSANAAMLALWGKDRNIIGKTLADAIPEMIDQPFLDILKAVWKSGETYLARNNPATLNVNGRLQLFYFDFEYKAILDDSGKTNYILHTAIEVSERMAAESIAKEKSIHEQQLSEELMAINEKYQSTNEELASLNEEYQTANENLTALNEEYQSTNEELLHFQEQLEKVNNSLRESEGRFRTLLTNAPVAVAIYSGEDTIIEQANAQMLKIWGQTERVIGMPLLEARPELLGHAYVDIIRKVIKEGISHTGYGVKGPVTYNGSIIEGYFDVIYKPILREDETVSGVIVVATDDPEKMLARLREDEINEEIAAINEELTASNEELLSSKKQLQDLYDNLNTSRERFRTMVEKSPVAMASLKGEELIVDIVNDRILEIWGNDHTITGKSLPELAGQPYLDVLRQVYNSGESFYGREFKVTLSRDGEENDHYLNFVYQPIPGTDGKTSEILIVANDVTDQVNARLSTDELNTRLQIALDASSLGSTEVELATGKMKSNDQFKQNFGFLAEEEFGYSDLLNAILPEHLERIKNLVREAIATNGVYHAEYPIYWKDGSVHWIKAHGRARYDEHGKANRMVGMTADITEEKLFEQRKDDFLSIASHELKTPITSLKASIQLLDRMKNKPFTEMHTRLIEQAAKSVEKMGVLVDELLNMNRISEDQLQLERTTFNLHDMLSLSCNHVRLEGIHELLLTGNEDLIVYADEHRIDQVVINFVNNAVKYAPDAKNIQILVEQVEQGAKVSVKDSGPGIEAHILPNLFDRYYRANHSGKAYTGLGLGLYICAEIIKKHGGKIGAESKIGEGSTFWFTLPL